MKTLLQPRFCVNIPPIVGPSDKPMWMAATLIPSTLPLSAGGYAEANSAIPVLKTIDAPIPCSNRKIMSIRKEGDNADKSADIVAITVPIVYAFFLPQISANRPNGSTKIAVANANDCANHPN